MAAPTVTAVLPVSASGVGGASIVLTGTNFATATAVMFGAVAAASFVINSSTQITAVAPAHAVGAVYITVVNPDGTSATGAGNAFTFVQPADIALVSPRSRVNVTACDCGTCCLTLPTAEDITAGQPIQANSDGKWVGADSTNAANSTGVRIALRSARKGESLTGCRRVEVDGFNLSALDINDPVYLSDAGGLNVIAGTVSVLLGRVTPGMAAVDGSADKLLTLEPPL